MIDSDFLDGTLDDYCTSGNSITVADEDAFLDGELGELAIVGELATFSGTDPRLKLFSHSSRLSLHGCPRKYQLYRLNSKEVELDDGGVQRATFDFGTVVGLGVQDCLEGKTEEQAIFNMAMAWEGDLFNEIRAAKKSFWWAVIAVQKFFAQREQGYLDGYELVYYNGKPAVELSFRITLPNGFKYRGYVDAVLKHSETGAVIVLECKTTKISSPNPANYSNSGQAIGYSIILDAIFPELNTYDVIYLVYSSSALQYEQFVFSKTLHQRALWLQELLLDMEIIELYESVGTYPMHGEHCFNFFRECEYLNLCTLPTDKLVKPLTQPELDKLEAEEYMFDVDFFALVDSQLELGGL